MNALVKAALEQVQHDVKIIPRRSETSEDFRRRCLTRAINSVDALKSALKAL